MLCLNFQETQGKASNLQVQVMMLWMTLMSFGVLFLTASFLAFPLQERVSKAKQLQLMTGTSPVAYWSTCFLWDFFLYLLVVVVMVIIVAAADPLGVFNGSEELGMYLLINISYIYHKIREYIK